jgi:hypothetical protein
MKDNKPHQPNSNGIKFAVSSSFTEQTRQEINENFRKGFAELLNSKKWWQFWK